MDGKEARCKCKAGVAFFFRLAIAIATFSKLASAFFQKFAIAFFQKFAIAFFQKFAFAFFQKFAIAFILKNAIAIRHQLAINFCDWQFAPQKTASPCRT
jgi:hypothetical protein